MIKGILGGVAAVAVMGVVATPSSAVTNLLANGSFETGSFSSWNYVSNATDGQQPVVIQYGQATPYPTGAFGEAIPVDPLTNSAGVSAGNFGAYFLSDSTTLDRISQTITLTDFTDYTVGFDYYLPFNGSSNAGDATLTVTFAGIPVATFVASTQTPGTWRQFSQTFSFPNGDAPSTGVLAFSYTSPATERYGKDFVIDALFVTATAELVPEPASWAMMVAGFGLMGVAMRRKRTSVAFAA